MKEFWNFSSKSKLTIDENPDSALKVHLAPPLLVIVTDVMRFSAAPSFLYHETQIWRREVNPVMIECTPIPRRRHNCRMRGPSQTYDDRKACSAIDASGQLAYAMRIIENKVIKIIERYYQLTVRKTLLNG